MKSRKKLIFIHAPPFRSVLYFFFMYDNDFEQKTNDDDTKLMNIDKQQKIWENKRKENLFGKLLNIFIHQIPKV